MKRSRIAGQLAPKRRRRVVMYERASGRFQCAELGRIASHLQVLVITTSLVRLPSVHAESLNSEAAGDGDGRTFMSQVSRMLLKAEINLDPGAAGTKLVNLAD
ncbi:hypothetical protein IEO21_07547 [Rhodonia placenta]|uniref:Uncharacterized protein n=1 Tax=Rhodonia placenta TaxID=104341 RepID=A0A8H7NY70_9APHY|nr:hypothetical protein IEO21_07547 [Postia placenta]